MNRVINEAGFKAAMEAGESWTTLDCQLTEVEDSNWYWEIQKTYFFTDNDERDGKTETLSFGTDDGDLTVVGKIWENLIEKYTPDEYFVDQHNHEDIDYNKQDYRL